MHNESHSLRDKISVHPRIFNDIVIFSEYQQKRIGNVWTVMTLPRKTGVTHTLKTFRYYMQIESTKKFRRT